MPATTPLAPRHPGATPRLIGIDFTSTPSRRKPITAAHGVVVAGTVQLQRIDAMHDMAAFEALLHAPGPWLAAFDFPFGLPREFVDSLALGQCIQDVSNAVRQRWPSRMAWRAAVDAWGNQRPAGQRLLHRQCDRAEPGVSSTSPLQTRYVPVGFMFYEGLPRLLQAGVTIPRMHAGGAGRVALEGYPGLLAHQLLGRRSYKNGDSAAHRQARAEMVARLQRGDAPGGLKLKLPRALQQQLHADAAGDHLDAVLCLMQAAWATLRPGYGLPAQMDAVEGWIVSAGAA